MAIQSFYRDVTVRVKVNFRDNAGELVNPASASLTLDFPLADGTRDQATVALGQSGDDWIYDWDSSVAAAGRVYGHAITDGSAPNSVVDFEFKLTTNAANEAA